MRLLEAPWLLPYTVLVFQLVDERRDEIRYTICIGEVYVVFPVHLMVLEVMAALTEGIQHHFVFLLWLVSVSVFRLGEDKSELVWTRCKDR